MANADERGSFKTDYQTIYDIYKRQKFAYDVIQTFLHKVFNNQQKFYACKICKS